MQVEIKNLTKKFGSITAVDDVSIVANEGELTTLVGPSGCGKTTTMRCVAGLERPDTGEVRIGDQVVTDLEKGVFSPPQKRNVGMVFQSFDVWAHMTVFENVAFPLTIRDYSQQEIEEKVMDILELANIEQLRDKNASELSGGQQARVGITRALVYEPKVLLCDEPLTGLDRNLRERMRYEIRELQQELGITTIYVTHSQPEAMAISDKICLLNQGRVEQEGSGREIYHEPNSRYVFEFFGSSQMFEGRRTDSNTIDTEFGKAKSNTFMTTGDSENVTIGFRPEEVELSMSENTQRNSTNTWQGVISQQSFLGDVTEYLVEVDGELIRSRMSREHEELQEDREVNVHVNPDKVYVFDGQFAENIIEVENES